MSRVGRCIDNGPMEAFWGTLKAEMFYLHQFRDCNVLKAAIEEYTLFYSSKRFLQRLRSLAPLAYRAMLLAA